MAIEVNSIDPRIIIEYDVPGVTPTAWAFNQLIEQTKAILEGAEEIDLPTCGVEQVSAEFAAGEEEDQWALKLTFQGEELLIYNEGYKMLYNEEADPHHMLKFR